MRLSDATCYLINTNALSSVFESAISAVYWFRMSPFDYIIYEHVGADKKLIAFYYTFKFVFIMWLALPQTK